MQPYTPPKATGAETPDEDRDLQAVTPTKMSRVAGGAAIGSGLYTLLLALQTTAALRLSGALAFIVPLMIVLGAALLVCGWYLRKMRGWAALGGTLIAGFTALLGVVWFLLSFLMGLLTLMPVIVAVAAAAACALTAMVVSPAKRADEARKRLAEQDLEF